MRERKNALASQRCHLLRVIINLVITLTFACFSFSFSFSFNVYFFSTLACLLMPPGHEPLRRTLAFYFFFVSFYHYLYLFCLCLPGFDVFSLLEYKAYTWNWNSQNGPSNKNEIFIALNNFEAFGIVIQYLK